MGFKNFIFELCLCMFVGRMKADFVGYRYYRLYIKIQGRFKFYVKFAGDQNFFFL